MELLDNVAVSNFLNEQLPWLIDICRLTILFMPMIVVNTFGNGTILASKLPEMSDTMLGMHSCNVL
jgi:hypothetical protein